MTAWNVLICFVGVEGVYDTSLLLLIPFTGGSPGLRERPLLQQNSAQNTHLVPARAWLLPQVGWVLCYRSWIACVIYTALLQIDCGVERQTRDQKVAGLNPSRSGGRIFFSSVNFACWLFTRCPFHPCVTAVALKRHRSFCQKCRWQVTPKYAYTFDPTELEWADYAAIQA